MCYFRFLVNRRTFLWLYNDIYIFFSVKTFSDKKTDPKISSSNLLDSKSACGSTLKKKFFIFPKLNSFSMREEKLPKNRVKTIKIHSKQDFHNTDFSYLVITPKVTWLKS